MILSQTSLFPSEVKVFSVHDNHPLFGNTIFLQQLRVHNLLLDDFDIICFYYWKQ